MGALGVKPKKGNQRSLGTEQTAHKRGTMGRAREAMGNHPDDGADAAKGRSRGFPLVM